MKNDQRKLFHQLIDKYEGSKLSTGKNKRKVSIRIPFNRQSVPDYFDEVNFRRVEAINESCRRLQELNYITIVWRTRDQYIDVIELNVDKVDDVYTYIKRPKKKRTGRTIETIIRTIRRSYRLYRNIRQGNDRVIKRP